MGKLSLQWLDEANKSLLSGIERICALHLSADRVSERAMACLNEVCQQNIVSFGKEQIVQIIECILSLLSAENVSLTLFCRASHCLISIRCNYALFLRHLSFYFYAALRRMIQITLTQIEKNENLLFVEQCSRMLCIVMRQTENAQSGEHRTSERKHIRIDELLKNKHSLIVHSDQLLLAFVHFINENPIKNVQKRMLMPAIFSIIDTLAFENIQKTANCIDQILFALPNKLKPTLKDIYSQYCQSKQQQQIMN